MTPGLERIISAERLGSYMSSSGFDRNRALRLYAWNMRMSAAFFPLIAAGEIAVRNLAAARIAQLFGPIWWDDPRFQRRLGGRGKGIVLRAVTKLNAEGKTATHGRLTSELSFGFWVNMLLPKYEHDLWMPLHSHFPDMDTSVDRDGLHSRLLHIQGLRNRIGHHEPIFQRNLTQEYADCLGLVRWMSAEKAAWIRPHCDVLRLMREKP